VQDILKRSPNDEGFAFFYCDRNEEVRRQPVSVLQSYVRQLSTTTRNPEHIQIQLRHLYKTARDQGSDLSFDACKQQLLESLNLYPKTTLVLDALDECDPASRSRLMETIELLLSKSKSPLKVFISSRPDRDIRRRFLDGPNIEIQARHNEDDIRKFVSEEVIKHEGWGEMSPSLQEDVVKVLLDRSEGMYENVKENIPQEYDC
jgi:hypothetical protein